MKQVCSSDKEIKKSRDVRWKPLLGNATLLCDKYDIKIMDMEDAYFNVSVVSEVHMLVSLILPTRFIYWFLSLPYKISCLKTNWRNLYVFKCGHLVVVDISYSCNSLMNRESLVFTISMIGFVVCMYEFYKRKFPKCVPKRCGCWCTRLYAWVVVLACWNGGVNEVCIATDDSLRLSWKNVLCIP